MDINLRLQEIVKTRYGLTLPQCTDSQLYHSLLQLTQELCAARPAPAAAAAFARRIQPAGRL